jgi:hypothetical protein
VREGGGKSCAIVCEKGLIKLMLPLFVRHYKNRNIFFECYYYHIWPIIAGMCREKRGCLKQKKSTFICGSLVTGFGKILLHDKQSM